MTPSLSFSAPLYVGLNRELPAQRPLVGAISPPFVTDKTPQGALLMNGASAYFIHTPEMKQSTVRLQIALPPGVSGSAGLLVRLLMDGSDATRQRLSQLNNQGLNLVALSVTDTLILIASGRSGDEPKLVNALLEILCRPTIQSADFERIRSHEKQKLQEIMQAGGTPLEMVTERHLYGASQPHSLTPQEIAQKLSMQTPNSVLNLHQQALQATGSVTWAMASSLAPASQYQLLNQASQSIGWTGNRSVLPPFSTRLNPNAPARSMLLVPNDRLKRALIQMTWQAPLPQRSPNNEDYAAFTLLQHILGGRLEGSFFKTLRTDQGLVYGIDAATSGRLGDTQAKYQADIEVDFDKIGPALNALRQVTQTLVSKPVAADVLTMAKNSFLFDLRDRNQTASGLLGQSTPWLLNNLPPPSMETFQKAIAAVRPEDIQRVAVRVFGLPQGIMPSPAGAMLPVAREVIGVSAPASALKRWFPNMPLTLPPQA